MYPRNIPTKWPAFSGTPENIPTVTDSFPVVSSHQLWKSQVKSWEVNPLRIPLAIHFFGDIHMESPFLDGSTEGSTSIFPIFGWWKQHFSHFWMVQPAFFPFLDGESSTKFPAFYPVWSCQGEKTYRACTCHDHSQRQGHGGLTALQGNGIHIICGWNVGTGRIWSSLSGWWLGHPSEKYESQLGWLFPIYGKITDVPNHQPVMDYIIPRGSVPGLVGMVGI